jgi:hypothetical protein
MSMEWNVLIKGAVNERDSFFVLAYISHTADVIPISVVSRITLTVYGHQSSLSGT